MTTHKNGGAFDAFISHSGSTEMAGLVFSALSRVGASPLQFGKWWKLRVFFDRRQIRAGDELPASISDAVQNSKYFVLLASKAAAQSRWVAKELEFWLRSRPASDILIVVLDGAIEWDQERGDFNWNVTDCIPTILKGKYKEEVCWQDLRQVSPPARTKSDKENLRNVVAAIGGKILDVDPADLIAKEEKTRRRFIEGAWVVVLGLITLAALAGYFWYTAETPADKAYNEGRRTLESRDSWYRILLALKSFERALELNPKHVPALLAKADAHTLLIGYGGSTNPTSDLDQAQEALDRAKQFGGEGTSEYYRIKGRLLLYKDRDVLGARAALTKAVEIDPDNVDARYTLAGTFTFMGQHPEATEECKKALLIIRERGYGENDNRFILAKGQLAWTYYYAREYDLAIAESLSIVNRDTNPQAHRFLAHTYLQTGNYKESVKHYLKAGGDDINREPNLYPSYICARMLNGELSQPDAEKEIQTLSGRVRYVSPYRRAQGHACIGATREALEELRKARDEHDLFVVWAAVDPLLSSLRGNPEFQDYLKSIGLGKALSQKP
jgi:tetratricopeptide (TPR) repeat protein